MEVLKIFDSKEADVEQGDFGKNANQKNSVSKNANKKNDAAKNVNKKNSVSKITNPKKICIKKVKKIMQLKTLN